MIWVSPCFGYPHTQIPSLRAGSRLGFMREMRDDGEATAKSLVKWVSPPNMAAVFSVSPGTLRGYPEP